MWNLKKIKKQWYKSAYLHNRNRLTDTESKRGYQDRKRQRDKQGDRINKDKQETDKQDTTIYKLGN